VRWQWTRSDTWVVNGTDGRLAERWQLITDRITLELTDRKEPYICWEMTWYQGRNGGLWGIATTLGEGRRIMEEAFLSDIERMVLASNEEGT
jgi:hypothetical protein